MKPLRSVTVSPGRPISRLTKVVPPSPASHFDADGGVVKTTICPRFGLSKSYASRLTSTRSLDDPRHHSPGLAQCSVGSIDDDGMRYGFAISASKTRTNAIATTIVTTQSASFRHGIGIGHECR